MINSNISLFLFYTYFLLFLLIQSCANIQAPSGGPPDKKAPEINEFYPQNKQILFNERYIKLKFDKYMDKSKVIENIEISPNIELEYDWDGKELEIELPEILDTNITYSLSLGTNYTDIYQNKPKSAFNLIFSPGSKIDSGFISGKVYADKPEGAYIFAYNISNILKDTLNISTTKPDYKTQLGTDGNFKITALKDGIYRLIVIRDQFSNLLYDPVDEFSAAPEDIQVLNSESVEIMMRLGPALDVEKPYILNAESVNDNLVIIKFNEIISPDSLSVYTFEIIQENTSKKIQIKSVFQFPDDNSKIGVVTSQKLDSASVYIVKADITNDFAVRDTTGNIINDSLNTFKFKASAIKDESPVKYLSSSIKDSSEFIPLNSTFQFIFDKPLDLSNSKISLKLIDLLENDTSDIEYFAEGSIIKAKPKNGLLDNKWYLLASDFQNIKSHINQSSADTAFNILFKTINNKIKGSASGTVKFETDFCNADKYVILRQLSGTNFYISNINEKNEWSFKNIEPAKYTAELFCDKDKNGRYSYGSIFPFLHSEPFIVFENEMNIKPRWTLENIILTVKN